MSRAEQSRAEQSRAEQSRAEQSAIANGLLVYTFFLIHRIVDELALVLLKCEGGLGSVFYVPCQFCTRRLASKESTT